MRGKSLSKSSTSSIWKNFHWAAWAYTWTAAVWLRRPNGSAAWNSPRQNWAHPRGPQVWVSSRTRRVSEMAASNQACWPTLTPPRGWIVNQSPRTRSTLAARIRVWSMRTAATSQRTQTIQCCPRWPTRRPQWCALLLRNDRPVRRLFKSAASFWMWPQLLFSFNFECINNWQSIIIIIT